MQRSLVTTRERYCSFSEQKRSKPAVVVTYVAYVLFISHLRYNLTLNITSVKKNSTIKKIYT